MNAALTGRVGLVAIGRNEGERLRRCLDSVAELALPFVYVDSASTDGSPELARSRGVEVVALDLSRPFTAPRARNEGFARLSDLAPALEYVQFVDGDCEIAAGWLELAARTPDERAEVVAVCGRRRERSPEASPYNRLADLEWNTPIGVTDACGGDVMMRAARFREVGGYDPSLISGEEPELCMRLRQRGGIVLRLDAEMTVHDAALTRLGQWWKRAERSGWAAGERLVQHGARGNPRHVRRALSAAFWGAALPAFAVLSTILLLVARSGWLALVPAILALVAYAILHRRIAASRLRRGDSARDARLYARYTLLGKLPEALGAAKGAWSRWRGHAARWIEYKDVVPLERSATSRGAEVHGR